MRWVVFNQKGGVGKSTLVGNLADFFEQGLAIRLFDESLGTFIHASPWEGLDVLPTQLSAALRKKPRGAGKAVARATAP